MRLSFTTPGDWGEWLGKDEIAEFEKASCSRGRNPPLRITGEGIQTSEKERGENSESAHSSQQLGSRQGT